MKTELVCETAYRYHVTQPSPREDATECYSRIENFKTFDHPLIINFDPRSYFVSWLVSQ